MKTCKTCSFDIWKADDTDLPFYNDLMKRPEYFEKEKGITGEIVCMEPEEYMRVCAEVQKSTVERQYQMLDPKLLRSLSRDMKKGDKMPLPLIDFSRGEQEGRHRAVAAKSLGHDTIPVLVVKKIEGGMAYTKPMYKGLNVWDLRNKP